MSIPGIGPVYAAGPIAEIGDVNRFENEAALAKYAGLTAAFLTTPSIPAREGMLSVFPALIAVPLRGETVWDRRAGAVPYPSARSNAVRVHSTPHSVPYLNARRNATLWFSTRHAANALKAGP